ncbi:MAG: hypothetical protein H6606_04405 [Flavobacteriales bacterium]|nr:hypothetical protein [Flavobacteriales bacterium]
MRREIKRNTFDKRDALTRHYSELIRKVQLGIPEIPDSRKEVLDAILEDLLRVIKSNKPVCLAFISEQNALRTQFAQIWGVLLQRFHSFKMLHVRSGGTNPTEISPQILPVCNSLGIPLLMPTEHLFRESAGDEGATDTDLIEQALIEGQNSLNLILDHARNSEQLLSKSVRRMGFPRTQTIAVLLSPEVRGEVEQLNGLRIHELPFPKLPEPRFDHQELEELIDYFMKIGTDLAYLFFRLQEREPRRILSDQNRWMLDKEIAKMIRMLDTATLAEEAELWNNLKTLPINWTLYFNQLYSQFNTNRGRYRLLSFILPMQYDQDKEELAMQAIADKNVDLRTFGFEMLALGQNPARLPQIRARLVDKSSKTRFEAALCIRAIEMKDPMIFNLNELSWFDRLLHRIHDKRMSRKYIPPADPPSIFK